MRRTVLAAIALSLVFVAACKDKKSDKQEPAKPGTASGSAPVAPKPAPAPLPPLAKDPGGATGDAVWVTGFGGLLIDTVRGLAVGPDGATYVAGFFEGEATFGKAGTKTAAPPADPKKPESDAFIAALGPDGTPAWVQTWGGGRADAANAVAVGKSGIAVAGNFLDQLAVGELTAKAAGSDDIYVMGFDPKGAPQWILTGGGHDSDGANAIVATADGGWLVGGSFSDYGELGAEKLKSLGKTDAFLAKLGATGDVQWVKTFGGPADDTIVRIALDPQGGIFVLGTFVYEASWGGEKFKAAGNSDTDIALAKYDADGNHQWSKRFGNAFNDVAGGLAVDQAGNVTFTGSFDQSIQLDKEYSSLGEADIVVARFSNAGELQWSRTWGSEREDVGYGVVADTAGNVIVTGWFQNRVDFGKGGVESKGNKDVFLTKLDPTGALVWVKTFGDKDHDQARALAIDAEGNPTVAGIFRFTMVLPPAPAIESMHKPEDRAPKPDAFVARFKR